MNRLLTHPLTRTGGFLARHFLALLVIVAIAGLLWTVTYFALLLWAVFAGGGIGGPLAFPAGLLLVLVAGTAASLAIYLPCTALAEWVAKRRGFPILAQIPITVAMLAVLCLGVLGTAAVYHDPHPTLREYLTGSGALFVANLLPLGLYWWAAQSGPLLLSLLQRLHSMIRG